MTTLIPQRQNPLPSSLPKRTSSLSSRAGSHRSSTSLSRPHTQTQTHKKDLSQGSLGLHSTTGSVRSSHRLQQLQHQHHNGHVVPRKRSHRVKSQYPVNSPEPHVEYILVASFDIDRGATMEHQYPGAISPDENMLAELMLPDQVHERPQDWTIFFLHKDAPSAEDPAAEEAKKEQRRLRRLARQERRLAGLDLDSDNDASADDADEDTDDDDDEEEGPPLMYVLNLVNTKLDATEKRGAKVQAMAICTRHSFLHIYKPLLLLALQDYFNNPSRDILENLYNAVNAMDLSLMPRLSMLERSVLQSNEIKDLFVEKFEAMIEQRQEDEHSGRLRIAPDSPTKPNQNAYSAPRDTHEFESKIVYNDIPIPVKIPTAPSPETVGYFSLIQLVQTFNTPHVTQPQPFALHPHLTTSGAYTHPIIVLINAILTEKRVIFLGHKRPSGEVAEAVLAACALASGGVLRGFTRHAFPYTDLSKIDELLKVPGFIAGVTNPNFSFHPEWWDILVDIPTGRIKISSSIAPAQVNDGTTYFSSQAGHTNNLLAKMPQDSAHDATGDTAFMEDIMASIESRQGESVIRAKFRSYIAKFTRIAAAFEETVYGASSLSVLPPGEVEKSDASSGSRKSSVSSGKPLKGHGYVWPTEEAKARELAATAAKIEGWRMTRSYYAFIQDLAAHSNKANNAKDDTISPISSKSVSMTDMLTVPPKPKPYLDIYHSLARLRTLRLLPSEAAQIFLALETHCDSYDSILEILVHTPIQEAGLFHISLGLWHEDAQVRQATTLLLDRMRHHPAGRVFFARLGGFANIGFQRALVEVEGKSPVASAGD